VWITHSSVIISETKPEYWATKPNVQFVEAFRVQFASNEKKTDWPKSAVIDDYFTFCTLEDYQTNAILWSHSTVCTGYTSISRNEGKQEQAAFQGCFGQRFGCQDNKPLTKCPEVSDHTLSYNPPPPLPKQTSSTPRKPPPQHTFDSGKIIKLNLYQTQTHTHKQQNKILASQSVSQSNNQF